MTKECKVILNNDVVTVVKFDEKEVQLPSVHRNADTLFVKHENGLYSIVDKMEDKFKDRGIQIPKKQRTNKKTASVSYDDVDYVVDNE